MDPSSLDRLNCAIVRCRRCPRLVRHREQVAREKKRQYRDWEYWGKPLPGFGDPEARLLLIGLAPAAHGGNRTGRMFTGDRSGDWLAEALHRYRFANQPTSRHRGDGFRLRDTYITAAVRCAPPGNKPTPQEMDHCGPYLLEELRVLSSVRVVVALGQVGFRAYLRARRFLGRDVPHPLPRFAHNRAVRFDDGTMLIASYHPSQQNTQTGKLTRGMFHAVLARARRLLKTSQPSMVISD